MSRLDLSKPSHPFKRQTSVLWLVIGANGAKGRAQGKWNLSASCIYLSVDVCHHPCSTATKFPNYQSPVLCASGCLVFWSCWSFLSHSRWLSVGMINPHSNKQPFTREVALLPSPSLCVVAPAVLLHLPPALCCCPNVVPKPRAGAGGWMFFLLYHQVYPGSPLSAYSQHTAPSIQCRACPELLRR